MERSARNRTISLSPEEKQFFQERVLTLDTDHANNRFSLADIENRTINADIHDIAPKLPQGFVNLLIADPPYNLAKNFSGSPFRSMSSSEYSVYTENWLMAVLPLLAPTASVYVCCDWRSSTSIHSVLERHLKIQNRITWQREKGRGAKANWKNSMEDIWFATVTDDYVFHTEAVKQKRKVLAPYREQGKPKDWEETADGNFRLTHPSNFWDDLSIPYWSMPENTDHPTQKPEKLVAKLILASSSPGDFVFDPFLGSGTTSVTAKKLGRRFSGVELSGDYCTWAEKRLEMATEQPLIQGYEDGVFWERNSRSRRKA